LDGEIPSFDSFVRFQCYFIVKIHAYSEAVLKLRGLMKSSKLRVLFLAGVGAWDSLGRVAKGRAQAGRGLARKPK